jgi:protease-4
MTFFLVSKKKIKNVKAIRKLRINSPGSGSTSDLIWEKLNFDKKIKTYRCINGGNYAASDGYYIACNANTILMKKYDNWIHRCFEYYLTLANWLPNGN